MVSAEPHVICSFHLNAASSFPEQEALCTEQTRKRLGQPVPGLGWFKIDRFRFRIVGFAVLFDFEDRRFSL